MKLKVQSAALCALAIAGCGGGSSGSPEQPVLNTAPLTASDAVRTRPGLAVDVDVLANDSDANGDALTVEAPASPPSAAIAVLPSGSLRVTPAAGFSGSIQFTYRARDSRGAFSAPTAVTVTVGPIARVMLSTYSSSPFDAPRVFLSGAAANDYLDLATLGSCSGAGSSVILASGATYVGIRCASVTRSEVILVAPRASQLGAPVVLLGNVSLARGIVVAANSGRFIVAERVTNPDDLSLPGTYELVSVDIATRAVVQRMPLAGVGEVAAIQSAGGSTGRVLVVSGAVEDTLFLADMTAGTVQSIADSGFPLFSPSFFMASPDGRFLVDRLPFFGAIQGYDLQNPTQLLSLWTPPTVSLFDYTTSAQFAQQPGATLLVTTRNTETTEAAVWAVPLEAPLGAREVTRYPATSAGLPVLVRGDLMIYGAAAANPLATEIRLVRISTGEQLGALSPPGGIENLDGFEGFTGSLVFFTALDSQQRRRAAFIRRDAPGIVQWIAPALEIAQFAPVRVDQDETTIGFTAIEANEMVAYIADINLPSSPVKVTAGVAAGEQTSLALVLGPPVP